MKQKTSAKPIKGQWFKMINVLIKYAKTNNRTFRKSNLKECYIL